MGNELKLQCTIDSGSAITLGGGHKDENKIIIRLKNEDTTKIHFSSGVGNRGTIFLSFTIGNADKDLVASGTEASAVELTAEKADWNPRNSKPDDSGKACTLEISLPKNILDPGEETVVTVKKIESGTDPGKAVLKIKAVISGYNTYETQKDVEKKATGKLQILYFNVKPPQLITETDEDKFSFEWNTIHASSVSLYKGDARVKTFKVGEGSGFFQDGKKFTFSGQGAKPDVSTTYRLEAVDKVDPTETLKEEALVFRWSRGWATLDSISQDFGYPSVLCNKDNVKLYGIFVKDGKACLCSSVYPAVVWDIEDENVPAHMATSSAVCFDNKLWLIGGSAADPGIMSNEVWSYDKGQWTQHDNARWSPRMGHSCLVAGGCIWVLGGMGDEGYALNEVWTSSELKEGRWERSPGFTELWSPRCMFAAAVFQQKFYIYGGVKEPFAEDPLQDIWRADIPRRGNNTQWQRYVTTKDKQKFISPESGAPIACALQVMNDKLYLLGTFCKGTETWNRTYVLQKDDEKWSAVPGEAPWNQQSTRTFSLSAAEFGGLLVARSLGYEASEEYRKQKNKGTLCVGVQL